MKEHPIIFSGEMVRAILDGRKTQTRRIVKKHPFIEAGFTIDFINDPDNAGLCPHGQSGDRLWVRETYTNYDPVIYRADSGNEKQTAWNSPLYMPRRFSRITLEITDVRVERLQDISNNDALAEGVPDIRTKENNLDMRDCFRAPWDFLNAKSGYSWDINPWVWVISFKRIEQGRKP